MRILWLDHPARVDRYDKWLHLEFAKKIRSEEHQIFFYAPRMHELEPDFTPISFAPHALMKNIVEELGIDIIILDTKSSIFYNYFPQIIYPERIDEGKTWLPKDFAKITTPKVCIEEDYHYEYSDKWYEDMGFKVLLQKHYSQSIREMVVPTMFFPFSVDIDTFKPTKAERRNKICIASIASEAMYPFRYRAMKRLQDEGLIDCFIDRQKVGNRYVKCLQEYTCHLAGGSRYNLTPAKIFEITASGSLLFTNKFTGIEKVLPDDCYVSYKNDMSDVVDKTRKILYNKRYREKITEKGMYTVRKYHSHEVRVKQLIDILREYV